jgi:hypothetical protein
VVWRGALAVVPARDARGAEDDGARDCLAAEAVVDFFTAAGVVWVPLLRVAGVETGFILEGVPTTGRVGVLGTSLEVEGLLSATVD